MLLDIYKDSFEFGLKKIPNLLILGILSFFSILIVPVVFFYGYNYRVVKQSTESMINGGDEPPEFDDWKRMFIDGLKVIIVQFIYLIVPILIIFFSFKENLGLGVSIGVILFIILFLISFIAIPNMAANNDSLKAAFNISEICRVINSFSVFKYVLACIGIALFIVVVNVVVFILLSLLFVGLGIAFTPVGSGALSTISLFGTLIMNFVFGFIISPFLALFQSRCAGLIYGIGA